MLQHQLRPSIEGVAKSLAALSAYLVNMIQGLRDAGPPAPLFKEDVDLDGEITEEFLYYNIQVTRVCTLDNGEWWAPGLTYPCGLPGHVCPEFWSLTPMDRTHQVIPWSHM